LGVARFRHHLLATAFDVDPQVLMAVVPDLLEEQVFGLKYLGQAPDLHSSVEFHVIVGEQVHVEVVEQVGEGDPVGRAVAVKQRH
jgi:hypothetical protein